VGEHRDFKDGVQDDYSKTTNCPWKGRGHVSSSL